MRHVLSIAGSDSSGGAGIQADLKTFAAHGVYGTSVITAVTAQNTTGVFHVLEMPSETITRQIETVFTDIPIHAVKIGMLPRESAIRAVAEQLKRYQPEYVVLDTVMISTSGQPLLANCAINSLIDELFPLVFLVTPNIPEAERITGIPILNLRDMEKAAALIYEKGPGNVLVKGGHAQHDPVDILFDGKRFIHFTGKRIQTTGIHGTGCTLSSAITANLSTRASLQDAVAGAKAYITSCMKNAFSVGKGAGVIDHLYPLRSKVKR